MTKFLDEIGTQTLWNRAKSYTDTQLKTITDNLTAEVVCNHSYEITGNTGDEHGLAVEDQQMLIKKIEGQTKVVNGNLVNSNCVLKSSGRNLIDCVLHQINGYEEVVFKNYVYLPKGKYDIFIETTPKTNDSCTLKIGNNLILTAYTFNTRQSFVLDKDYYGPLQGYNNKTQTSVKISIWYRWDYSHVAYEPFKEDIIEGIGELGQFDYIQGNKKVLHTSQVKLIDQNTNFERVNDYFVAYNILENASESYDNNNNNNNNRLTPTNWNILTKNQADNCLATLGHRVAIRINSITTKEQLREWLAQNPIQLVYKLATPTITDVNLPSGYAAYNGGLQSQVGQVPYKITKQYNLSQKAQILANVEIDREQQALIDNTYNKAEVDSKVPTITFENGVLNITTSNK